MNKAKVVLGYIAFAIIVNYVGYSYFFGDMEIPESVKTEIIELPVSLPEQPLYSETDPEVICMAENLFHEARNQEYQGIKAVAFVTMNRVNHAHFPNDVCGVVYDHAQFSWTLDNLTVNLSNSIEADAWATAIDVALKVMNGEYMNTLYGVLYYHNHDVAPHWAQEKTVAVVIDDHIFYNSAY